MRVWLALVVSVLLAIHVPGATAQSVDHGSPVWSDPPGDVKVDPPLPGEDYPNADLLSLKVREVPSGFWFFVDVEAMASTYDEVAFTGMQIWAPFELRGEDYELRVARAGGTLLYYSAALSRAEDVIWRSDSWNDDTILVNTQESWITTFVPRAVLVDEGPLPGPEDTLRVGQVRSLSGQAITMDGSVRVEATDLMPDEAGTLDVPVRHGAVNEGETWMSSPMPFRSSNGGAGGVLYDLTIHNDAAQAQTYVLGATDTSSQVTVRLPSAGIDVAAGESLSVPAYIEVPFGHSHGGFVATTVEARSATTQDVGRIQIGIEYLDIPQPAGHHDRLFFHHRETYADSAFGPVNDAFGGGSRTQGFMNAMEEDMLDTGEPIPAFEAVGHSDGSTTFRWVIELDPRLAIGLDFRHEETGRLAADLQSELPVEGTAWGRLVWLAPGESGRDPARFSDDEATILGTLERQDVSVGSSTPLETELVLSDASDQVVYVEGSDLMLEIFLETPITRLDAGDYAPQIQPGGTLDVPLDEYRDPLDDVFESTIQMRLEQPARTGNPGDRLVTYLDVSGPEGLDVVLSATSDVVDVAFPHGTELALEAGTRVPVVITIPDAAAMLEDVPVFFLAESKDGSAAAILLLDIVEEPVDDDSAEADALTRTKDTPFLPLAVTLLVLVLVGRRRK